MQITSLKTDADFLNAVVPEGYLLVFMSKDSDGNLVRRYKNSAGEFGSLGGSTVSGGGGAAFQTARTSGKEVEEK